MNEIEQILKTISDFVDSLSLPAAVRKELHKITPSNYTGKFEIKEK